MPRPGPRSYECVRRAWHSDAHQVLRATLTQEILRIASELHKEETRNKKEWQEQLPNVVLRAEEIMYSKARSEEDYSDFSTLRARLDDAVNTIIRVTDEVDSHRDGPFLEPCIEAALSLACSSRKSIHSKGRPIKRAAAAVTNYSDVILSCKSGSSGMNLNQQQQQPRTAIAASTLVKGGSNAGPSPSVNEASSGVTGKWCNSGSSSDTFQQLLSSRPVAAFSSSFSSSSYASGSLVTTMNSSSAGSSPSSSERDELELCLGLPQHRDDPSSKKQKLLPCNAK